MAGQIAGADRATFDLRAAEFEVRKTRLGIATDPEEQAVAALEWLRALGRVLETIPPGREESASTPWLRTHADLIVYDEVGGDWLIQYDLLDQIHRRHITSAVADEIAWTAVVNGLGGECEGYAPCYVHRVNVLFGTYLRRHPRGVHRAEAFEGINKVLSIVVNDLLRSPIQETIFSVANDCDDLLEAARPLHVAIAGADATAETIELIDRVIAVCPAP